MADRKSVGPGFSLPSRINRQGDQSTRDAIKRRQTHQRILVQIGLSAFWPLYNPYKPLLPQAYLNAICRVLTFFYFDLLSPSTALSLSIQTYDARLPQLRGQHQTGDTDMPAGTVKWFNTTKGYGFIAPEDGGKDIFVHISSVERSGLTGLADNQKVTYELRSGRDGRESADNIQLA